MTRVSLISASTEHTRMRQDDAPAGLVQPRIVQKQLSPV